MRKKSDNFKLYGQCGSGNLPKEDCEEDVKVAYFEDNDMEVSEDSWFPFQSN